MVRKTFKRAWQYYKLYGRRHFFWAVRFKARQRLNKIEHYLRSAGRAISGYDHHATYQIFPSLELVDVPSRNAEVLFRHPAIAIIADLNLPQCRKYRVLQKIEALEQMGVNANYSHWQDIPRSMNLLQMATFVIFYRVQDGALLNSYLSECKRLRVSTAYDIDDPIFSRKIYENNKNLIFLENSEKLSLLESTDLYLKAMKKCDAAIVSTPRMAGEAEALCKKPTYVWRNAIDQETLAAAHRALSHNISSYRSNQKTITIVYASGSRAHEADFREVEDTISRIFEEYPEVRLSVVGHLELPDSLRKHKDRVSELSFSEYAQYIETVAKADINIIPLVIDDFNDCKSAIRYMEAALLGVPTIASSVGDFRNVIHDGENGYLAETPDGWYGKLVRLLDNADLRLKIGKNANESVNRTLRIKEVSDSLPDKLKDFLHGSCQ